MAKATKKKNRKLRRQVRKTVGALLMTSAIVVAAVPVTDVTAYGETDYVEKVKVVNYTDSKMKAYETINGSAAPATWQSKVPYVDKNATIYTDETGTFQFAFIPASDSVVDDVAVIMGVDSDKIQDGKLEIFDYVDAYKKYLSTSTATGYCAVNRSDKYLYYQADIHQQDDAKAYLFTATVNQLNASGERLSDEATGKVLTETKNLTSKDVGMSVNEDGDWYYTRTEITGYTSNTTTDPETGEEITESVPVTEETVYYAQPVMKTSYLPCYKETKDTWVNETLYYWGSLEDTTTTDDPTQTNKFHEVNVNSNAEGRICNAAVRYIGRQNVVGSNGEWKVGELAEEGKEYNGVFYNNGHITDLIIGDNLVGIGDYAFYRCTGIDSVSLGGSLNTIGNSAFAECSNMMEFKMDLHSKISVIGKEAFLNCRGLEQIQIPVSVDAIGDYCFSGCSGMKNIYMCAELDGEKDSNGNVITNMNLTTIGFNAFENCSALQSLTFPDTCAEKLPITYLSGCTLLQYIKSNNKDFDLIDGSTADDEENNHNDCKGKDGNGCDITKFLNALKYSDSFYFEGEDDYAIHQTARDHSAAFKYAGTDPAIFEKVIRCPEDDQHEATYKVNSDGDLISMTLDPKCQEIDIPASVGGYGITTIKSSSFKDNCFLKKITIPNTVNSIESGAFQGCHNLKYVIFSQPNNPNLEIGQGAFNTQQVSSHMTGCDKKMDSEPFLSFTGDISYSSAAFQYAMDPANNIDVSGQEMNSYITFYSGWPTNLAVKYNPSIDKNELIDYPRYSDLTSYEEFDLASSDRNSLPYITKEYAKAASEAKIAVESYENESTNTRPTQDQYDIVNAALNVNLPAGIEAIAEGIFSGVDSDNKAASELIWQYEKAEDGSEGEWKKIENPLSVNEKIQTITMNTVDTVDSYAFANCTGLTGVYMAGGSTIDDYAFKDCTNLANVEISSTVSKLGLRPFVGCTKLTDVDFKTSTYYTCDSAIIYGLENGVKSSIVECLEARGLTYGSSQVGPDELAGVTSIEPEAFKNCDGIGNVDFTASSITDIPKQCFAQTGRLSSVYLPDTAKSIDAGAFWNSNLFYIKIPTSVTYIEPQAFANVSESDGEISLDEDGDPEEILNAISGHTTVTVYCTEGSAAETYAKKYYYMNPVQYEPEIYHTVYFWDNLLDKANPTLLDTQQVLDGEDAVPPTPAPSHEGYTFTGWSTHTNIVRDMDVYAQWGSSVWVVTFMDTLSGKILSTQYIEDGKSAEPPTVPEHEGYTFTGWAPDYNNITDNTIIITQYKDNSGDGSRHTVTFYSYDGTTIVSQQKVNHGEAATAPMPPVRSGYTFSAWVPGTYTNVTSDMNIIATYKENSSSGSGNGNGSGSNASPSPTATPNPEDSVKKYTVSVSGGSGSGSYAAGEIVAINAYDMGEGQNFDKWTSSTAGVGFANPNATSTTFTMPAANVAITATYKTGSGSSSSGSTGSGSGSGSVAYNSGTIVDVDRSGISNTNLAGATVSGSTDNFIVKVTEDQSATDAVIAALQAKYGDISRIKYLPMDISLYDSTGRIKIADTSGITVNLTLPLPDDLVQYAGNNRVAAVSNGALEELNARFTTVDGVPCVNFTATHFSPYVIYVDTANLTEATIDATPKTGDPIHPKWFLALGLACISLILFFKRDKVVINTKTA